MVESLRSNCSPGKIAGSPSSVKQIAKNYRKNVDPTEFKNILGPDRRDFVDHVTFANYDFNSSMSGKLVEMDDKLNKICERLDIEA